MGCDSDPSRFPDQLHFCRGLYLAQHLDRSEAIPHFDCGITLLQSFDQLQLPGEASVHRILHHGPAKCSVHFVGVHAVQLFRTVRETEGAYLSAEICQDIVHFLYR
jgi:hypothetical protein